MNNNRNTVKKRERNMINKMLKDMNALKNAKYSGIYVVVCFFEQTIILELLKDISCSKLFYAVFSFLSIIVMFALCHILTKRAKKQIESRKNFPESDSESDKWIECATMLGYLSPVLCLISWFSGFSESADTNIYKWLIIAVVVVCGIVLPLVVKKKNKY